MLRSSYDHLPQYASTSFATIIRLNLIKLTPPLRTNGESSSTNYVNSIVVVRSPRRLDACRCGTAKGSFQRERKISNHREHERHAASGNSLCVVPKTRKSTNVPEHEEKRKIHVQGISRRQHQTKLSRPRASTLSGCPSLTPRRSREADRCSPP